MTDFASLSQSARATLEAAMRAAGATIERLKAEGVEARDKADRSPVTIADEAAETILAAAVRAVEPQALIIGEEAAAAGHLPPPSGRFWLIDPLDGTRDFLGGREGYTVNLGLVVDGNPVFGLVLHPPSGRLWTGSSSLGAERVEANGTRTPIAARALPQAPALVVSHSHLDDRTAAWADAVPGATRTSAGSSIKFCLLAEGTADAYPRYGPTMEWDTAAADAVLRAAGGATFDEGGQPFRYGKPGYRNAPFLAVGDPGAVALLPRFGG
ncbi:MAG: 3'(2'),5'-bisphosphate nucleotidase CysQ [Sphingomonadaceae bacterium]